LIELLVVISTITALLSILLPSLTKARSRAIRLKCTSNLRQIFLAVDSYLHGNDQKYPCAQDPVSLQPYYWLWMGRGWRDFIMPHLNTGINSKNPSVLFCPADKSQQYESTSYAYSMSFYHTPSQINSMTSPSDTYNNPQPSQAQSCLEVSEPSHKILFGEWLSNHEPIDPDGGWWCWQGTRNYLFADGSIRFLQAKQIRPANGDLPDANLTRNGIKGRDYSP